MQGLKRTEKEQQFIYADAKIIITEMLKTALIHLKKNYDLEYGEGSAERLLNNYGPVMLGDIICGDRDPAFERLLSDMAKTVAGDKVSGLEVDFVIFPTRSYDVFGLPLDGRI